MREDVQLLLFNCRLRISNLAWSLRSASTAFVNVWNSDYNGKSCYKGKTCPFVIIFPFKIQSATQPLQIGIGKRGTPLWLLSVSAASVANALVTSRVLSVIGSLFTMALLLIGQWSKGVIPRISYMYFLFVRPQSCPYCIAESALCKEFYGGMLLYQGFPNPLALVCILG